MASNTDEHEYSTNSSDEYANLLEFLQLTDLLLFKEKFVGAGVTKVEHLEDVEEKT